MKKYKLVVFIGRFQPVHRAHIEIIKRAQNLGEQTLVLVGSSNLPRTYLNPFSYTERVDMIRSENIDNETLSFSPLIDFNDDTAWAANVQKHVNEFINLFELTDQDVAIIGHNKDSSSFYLNMFPQWTLINVEQLEPLNATDIRDIYFRENANINYLNSVVPSNVLNYLEWFKTTQEYGQIIRERRFIEDYKRQYEHLPYEPVFVTVDAVVFQAGHVLMVKRRSEPGKGLWALPGGFLNASTDRSLEDAAIRELKEETCIKVPVPVLKGSIKGSKVFDSIHRSARGRTITHTYNIVLNETSLPKVKGADDAEIAKWIPISALNSQECFEDHFLIIQNYINN